MLLPKEERKLLKCYFNKSKKTRKTFEIGIPEVMKILGFREDKASAPATDKMFDITFNANAILKDRELIHFEHEQEDLSRFKISLTLEGYDLGRKYSSKLYTFLLLCNEYKVWIILGLIISVVSVLVMILKD